MTTAVPTPIALSTRTERRRPARDRSVALALALLVLAYYLLIMGGHQYSIDGATIFQAARTMVAEHSLFFNPPLIWGATFTTSKYGIGLSLSYLPLLLPLELINPSLVAYSPASNLKHPIELLYNDLFTLSSITNPLISALTVACTYLLARELGMTRRWGAIAALVSGMASPLTDYTRFDFTQPLIALCLVAPLWLMLRAARRGSSIEWLGAGVILGYGVLTRVDFLIVVPWFVLLAWFVRRNSLGSKPGAWLKPILLLVSPVVVAGLLTLAVNTAKFGSPFNFGYDEGNGEVWNPLGMVGLSVSPGKGILIYYPLTLLLIFGIPALWRAHRRFTIVLTGILLTEFLFFSFYKYWWGSWDWGPRYIVPLIPLITIAVTFWAEQSAAAGKRAQAALYGGLVALSFVISLNAILYNYLDFYTNLYVTVLKRTEGEAEHFAFFASPIFAGWSFPRHLSSLDLYLPSRIKEGSLIAAVVFVALGALFLGAALWLKQLLLNSENFFSAVDG